MAEKALKVRWLGDATDAERAANQVSGSAGRTEQAVAGVGSRMKGAFSGFAGAAQQAGLELGPLANMWGQLGSAVDGAGGKLIGAGVGIGAAGALFTGMAQEGIRATAQLKTAIDNTGNSYDEFQGKVNKVSDRLIKLGFDDEATVRSLATLTTATQDPQKALDSMGLAADIARSRHVSLEAAADMLAKGYSGNAKVFKQFGIDLKSIEDPTKAVTQAQDDATKAAATLEAATESNRLAHMRYDESKKHSASQTEALRLSDEKLAQAQEQSRITTDNLHAAQDGAANSTSAVDQAMAQLADRVKGQASAQADNLGTKLTSLKIRLENVGEAIGQKVGPAMTAAGPILAGMGGLAELHVGTKLVGAFAKVGPAVSAMASGVSGAMSGMAAFIVSPAGLIILSIAAIAAIGYVVWRNWDTIKEGISAAWGWIKERASSIWSGILDFFKAWWPLLLGIFTGGIGLVIGLIIQHWDWVTRVTGEAWDFVTGIISTAWEFIKGTVSSAVSWVGDRLSDMVAFFASIPGRVWDAASSLVDNLWNLGTSALGAFRDAVVSGAEAVFSWVAGIPGGILDAIGNLGSLLYNAGRAVLTGFLDGLKSVWGSITNFVSGIGGWIADHKGPLDADRVLLRPAGAAILGGLVGGMQERHADLVAQVDRINATLGRAGGGVTVGAGAPGLAAGGVPGPSISLTVELHVDGAVVGTMDQLAPALLPGFLELERQMGALFKART